MQNLRLATRYAKSLFELAVEKGQVDTVYNDMLVLQAICNASPEFKRILNSPIIKADKKKSILEAVTSGKISEMTARFNTLLVQKGRESEMSDIITAFVKEYKVYKGIKTLKLTTAVPVSDEIKKELIEKVQKKTQVKNIELEEVVNPDIIGGFILQVDDMEVDTSVSFYLNQVKKQFLNNDFVYKIK
ncbi:ATP synthase F1 subunit delta [Pinibacter aurantiacus]|uniref:ATP synthase subunit delta n=1 Tax=Pinibacter aurantiacus TaxID=2851599 RepID=A0A9E2W4Z4_9BACT|nr:ATP synthase F1 subunit delta [Pinibacter aurantiacus]MBV4358083.1 F0F1 ATP synthase subunit delta [Pinibacter aurantiacus]